MDFTDKRVLVTGASRGIGFEIAKNFLDAGAHVAINGSTEQSAAAAMERLSDYEHTVAAPGNLGTVAGCEAAVGAAIEAFGGLDVLVNNAGVVNMSRAMALEIAPDVRVNCVCPGYVDTDMIRVSAKKKPDPEAYWQKMIDYAPLKRIASTDEIAHGVMYLASDHARFITGTSLAIDGGSTAGK